MVIPGVTRSVCCLTPCALSSAAVVFSVCSYLSSPAAVTTDAMVQVSCVMKGRLVIVADMERQIRLLVILTIGIAYVIEIQVIAWRHVSHNVWRYELAEIDSDATLVTKSWDGRKARTKWWVNSASDWESKAIAKTLVKLKRLMQG